MKYLWLIFWGLGSLFLVFGASDAKNEKKHLFSDSYRKDVYHSKKGFKCPTLYGAFPDTTDCAHFYVCIAGMEKRKKCPSKQHFDIWRKKCMPKAIAICGSDKTTTSTKAATTTVSTKTVVGDDFKCPKRFGTYPHPKDCSKYYSCMAYIPILQTCAEGQLFDTVKSSCKSEKRVDCGSRQRPGYTSPISTDLTITETFSTLSTKDDIKESTTEAITTTTEEISTTTEAISTTTEEISTTTEGVSTTTEGVSTTAEAISTTAEAISTTEPISTTTEPISTTTEPISTTTEPISTTKLRPTGPPEHNCDEDDVDCIITETGDVKDWFTCPKDIASFPHPSSDKLFIFCMNRIPSVKKCGMDQVFSTELSTCIKI